MATLVILPGPSGQLKRCVSLTLRLYVEFTCLYLMEDCGLRLARLGTTSMLEKPPAYRCASFKPHACFACLSVVAEVPQHPRFEAVEAAAAVKPLLQYMLAWHATRQSRAA